MIGRDVMRGERRGGKLGRRVSEGKLLREEGRLVGGEKERGREGTYFRGKSVDLLLRLDGLVPSGLVGDYDEFFGCRGYAN